MGGWLGAIGSMFSWLGGEGIGASLARIAIGLGISKLLNKTNESAAGSSSSSTPQGTRQQIAAATDNKIPVAYGDSYFSGTVVDQRTINDNKETVVVLDLCELTGDIFSTNPTVPGSRTASDIIIDAIYLNNQIVTFKADGTTIDYTTDDTGVQDTNAQGLCGIYLYKGSSNSPMLPCTINTRTAIAGTVPPVAYQVMPGWDNSYTNQNKIFALVKMNYDPSKGLHALPEFKFHVRNTMNKVGDCLHDYMTNVMYGAGLPEGLVDNQSIIDLNAYGDELVTLGSYPAQPRYRINGLVRTTETNLSNMEKLAAAGGSMISYDLGTGKFAAVVNKLVAKTLDFDDSNILGGIALNSTDLTAAYNKVEVQFPYKVLKDQYNYVRFDLPEIYRNANEPDNTMQITHEFVNDPVQATILANLDLRQAREDLSITFKTDYSKYNVAIGAVIGVTNSVYGWDSKQFKVIRIRKNESDSGQLTIEITAQAYNPDVFTVEDISDFVPLIGVGHSLPALTAIQRPLAPTVTSSTLSSQPSVSITGIIPEGLVTLLEFWQTTDTGADTDATPYTLIGSMRPENGGLFTIGDVVTFRTVELRTGTYRFKVRASYNGTSTSKFSPPSTSLAYTYVQAPDVLKYTTPSVGEDGVVDEDSVNYGLMAAFLGYKIFEKPITDYLKEKFGLTDEQATKAAAAIAKDNLAANNAASSVGLSNKASSDAAAAQTTANKAAADAKAALDAVNSSNHPIVIYGATLNGEVFPCLFGSGVQDGLVDSRAGIFTHANLVFAGSAVTSEIGANNVVSAATTLSANIAGQMQNFYCIPSISSGTWSKPPVYDESLTDQYTYNSTTSLYYSEATYTSGNLDQQSWSNWKLLNSTTGVEGLAPNTIITTDVITYTNPEPTATNNYLVDGQFDHNGVAIAGPSIDTALANYDPFKPNIAVTTRTLTKSGPTDTRIKHLDNTLIGNYDFPGDSTKLIMFGVSVFNLPDNTPVANNTVFGHVGPKLFLKYPNAIAFKQIDNNGSRFVGINSANNKVYWSEDGRDWNRVQLHSAVTTQDQWDLSSTAWRYLLWDGTKFIAYGHGSNYVTLTVIDNTVTPGTIVATPMTNWSNTATSTDGKVWVEFVSEPIIGRLVNPIQIAVGGGKYVAINTIGIQTSTDGITWGSNVTSTVLNTVIYDGSKFIGGGSKLYSSTDGITWTVLSGPSNPAAVQSLTDANRNATDLAVKRNNTSTVGYLF